MQRLRPSYEISTGLFLRLLGLVYLVAIGSLWLQVEGLVGSRGILPVADLLGRVAESLGSERFYLLPTLSWLSPSDAFLHVQCAAAVLLAVLVIAGRFHVPSLLILWVVYLSLVTAGQDFLGFQWDNLLLEAGLLSVFLAPWKPRTGVAVAAPSPAALWLLRLLLFKLMFSSGVVKLSSGDEAWHSLTALVYHYETQPIPNPLAWYVHQLPVWFQKLSTVSMFFIELVVPFAIFAPARVRRFAGAGLVALQVLIAVTGNFAFFNLLTAALCLLLVDDAAWPRRWRRRTADAPLRRRERAWRWAVIPAAVPALVLMPFFLVNAFRVRLDWPRPVTTLYRWVSPLRSWNGYGLFAVMTTERPEIVVEGSLDGVEWRPYGFRFKPGDLTRRPPFVAPHQPRLDWQMWFAALGNYRRNPWFVAFLARLAEGSPAVLGLLEENPFPEGPPRYLRARLYDYHFTDFGERAESGAWWRREERGLYFPEVESERLLSVLER